MKHTRRVWLFVGIAILVVALPAAWLGIRGWAAKSELESAEAQISVLKAEALAYNVAGATASLDRIDAHVTNAVGLTSDPVWRLAELIPVLGSNLTAVRELSAATQDVIGGVVGPLVDVVGTVDPAALAPKDGAIDLSPIVAAIPAVSSAHAALGRAVLEVEAIDTSTTVSQVVAAKEKVSTLLASVIPILDLANEVLPLVPAALGSEGARTYAVMFQNNAEPRALGGTALSFALLTVDQGRISLSDPIPAGSGVFPVFDPPLVSFPPGSQNIYPDTAIGAFVANVTTRPSFVTAATVTQAMWVRSFGYPVDGVVSVDPVFLSYVLRATDPFPLSTGEVLSSDNLVSVLLNGVYQRYNSDDHVADDEAQNAVYGEVLSSTFSQVMGGAARPPELLAAVLQGWSENRLLLWSAREDEEAALTSLGLRGEIPVSDPAADRLGIYIQDYVGSKLGFYLQQAVRLEQGICRPDNRASYRATVDLTSAIDPAAVEGLSRFIVGQWERERVPRGTQRLIVMLYAPPGSEFTAVTINGEPVGASGHYDAGHPVDFHIIEIPPGQTVSLAYDVVSLEPGSRALEASITPLVNPTPITAQSLDCATIPAP